MLWFDCKYRWIFFPTRFNLKFEDVNTSISAFESDNQLLVTSYLCRRRVEVSLTEKILAPRSPPVRRRETRTGGPPASRTTRTRSRSGPGRTGRTLRV